MATYQELFDLQRDQTLLDKITVAVMVAADTVFTNADTADPPWAAANHANRVIWAREATRRRREMAEVFMAAVLAKNKNATEAQILGATDATIQGNVDEIVDSFADGNPVLG